MLFRPTRTATHVTDMAPLHTQTTTHATQVLRDQKGMNQSQRINAYGKQFTEHISGFFSNHEIQPFCDVAAEDDGDDDGPEVWRCARVCTGVAASICNSCVCVSVIYLCMWFGWACGPAYAPCISSMECIKYKTLIYRTVSYSNP